MFPAPTLRRSALRTVPRAAAALLALLLSVLAGPRGGADDRRAERLSGEAAQVAPIYGPFTAVLAQRIQISTTVTDFVMPPRAPRARAPDSAVAVFRPLRTSPVAARAP